MTDFYTIEHLGDDATDDQLQTLRETVEILLDADALLEQAHRVRDEYFDQCCLEDDTDALNQDLQWELEDMLFEYLQPYYDLGFLPKTDGHAHDVVTECVGETANELLRDVRITEEDIFIEQRRIREEPDPDYEYERRMDI